MGPVLPAGWEQEQRDDRGTGWQRKAFLHHPHPPAPRARTPAPLLRSREGERDN